MKKKDAVKLLGILSALFLAARASAHDCWLEPKTFRPGVGQKTGVRMFIGEDLTGKSWLRRNDRLIRFETLAPDGAAHAIEGKDGDEPLGAVELKQAGVFLAGYRGNKVKIEFDPKTSVAYLTEEGLGAVLKRRIALGEGEKPWRELYSRAVKTAISSCAAEDAACPSAHDRRFGFALEIVPRQNPARLKTGDRLEVDLLYEGKPLADAYIAAQSSAAVKSPIEAHTDAHGRSVFTLDHPGLWVVKSVHMKRLDEVERADSQADWESIWASFSFWVLP